MENQLVVVTIFTELQTAELKRVNRILKDNEIFALRVVKIPARCYSLLTERLPSVHTAACTAESSRGAPHATPIGPHAPVIQPRDFQAAGDAASVTGLLDVDGEDGAPSPYEADTKEFAAPYNGADWGLSWLTLLMAALILGFVGPIVLYITLIVHKKT
ncbi:hypothetical protein PR048_020339 [Dryococelus australis]|uniref:Uncharacterized protein n=1 Tax=Dryococelus australis TaxID=614101 RepID=A0ABQ9H626_9NEOP|nr:hypothetical protein PR048_020339 [Dryococelus australis]